MSHEQDRQGVAPSEGPLRSPRFALTFDDGPGPSTPGLLDVLGPVRATFFLLGRNLEDPALRPFAQAARDRGHILGNHTYSHFRPHRWRELAADARRGEAAVRALVGPSAFIPFRLPYGIVPGEVLDPRVPVIASLGFCHQHWTSDFADWKLKPGDGPALAARMIRHIEDWTALGMDAVLDLHDSDTGSSFGYDRSATVEGVRILLDEARRRGWRTFTVP